MKNGYIFDKPIIAHRQDLEDVITAKKNECIKAVVAKGTCSYTAKQPIIMRFSPIFEYI